MTANHGIGTRFCSSPVNIIPPLNNPRQPDVSLAKHQMELPTHIWGSEVVKTHRTAHSEAGDLCSDMIMARGGLIHAFLPGPSAGQTLEEGLDCVHRLNQRRPLLWRELRRVHCACETPGGQTYEHRSVKECQTFREVLLENGKGIKELEMNPSSSWGADIQENVMMAVT